MCNQCFTAQRKSFPDKESWTSFDLALTRKLVYGKMKSTVYVPAGKSASAYGKYIYTCLSCGEQWKVKDSDNNFNGHLLPMTMLDKLTVHMTFLQRMVVGLLGLVFIISMIYKWFMQPVRG